VIADALRGMPRGGDLFKPVGYLMLVISGLLYVQVPSVTLYAALGWRGTQVWGVYVAVGALVCALGSQRPEVERVGLVLLAFALGILAIAMFIDTGGPARPGAWFTCFVAVMLLAQRHRLRRGRVTLGPSGRR